MESVNNYNKNYNLKEKLIFAKIQSNKLFKIPKSIDETKTWRIGDLSEIFPKDGVKLLPTPITQLCSLSSFF